MMTVQPVKSEFNSFVTTAGEQIFDGAELTDKDVFSALAKIIGLMQGKQRSAGFFAYENGAERSVFITTSHSSNKTVRVFSSFLEGINQESEGRPIELDEERTKLAEEYDIQFLNSYSQQEEFFIHLPFAPDDYELEIGTEVYFAGFPIREYGCVFHKAHVSSLSIQSPGITTFTLDGTVVPGHSGAPVAVKSKDSKQIYLIGMICAQVMDYKQELEYLCHHQDQTVQSIGKVVKANMSTGLGRALDIRKISKLLLSKGDLPSEAEEFAKTNEYRKLTGSQELEVGKPAVRGNVGSFKFFEYFTGNPNGAGPRGITFKNSQGTELLYMFDPNPHGVKGYKNNKKPELYEAAAQAFWKIYEESNEAPQEFIFTCYKHEFAASLQGN